MQVIMYQTNAFTDVPFGGRSAAIVPDANSLSDEDIQSILRVVKLEKTAFIFKIDEENYRVRFFREEKEIKFCGYATIASFFTLGEKGYLDGVENGKIRVYQHTEVGTSPIDIHFENWKIVNVEMYKNTPTLLKEYREMDGTEKVLNIKVGDVGLGEEELFPELIYSGNHDIIVPVKSKEILNNVSLNHRSMMKILKNSGISIEETPWIHVFTINKNNHVECRQFEVMAHEIKERSCSGSANVGMVFYLNRHSLLNGRKIVCNQGDYINSPSIVNCSVDESELEHPIKIGGMGNIFFEGVVRF